MPFTNAPSSASTKTSGWIFVYEQESPCWIRPFPAHFSKQAETARMWKADVIRRQRRLCGACEEWLYFHGRVVRVFDLFSVTMSSGFTPIRMSTEANSSVQVPVPPRIESSPAGDQDFFYNSLLIKLGVWITHQHRAKKPRSLISISLLMTPEKMDSPRNNAFLLKHWNQRHFP